MSYTEIYGFDKEGNAYSQGEVRNAHRGAMAIWNILEERYLPPYIPDYVKYCNWYRPNMSFDEIVERNGFKPSRCSSIMDDKAMKEVWNLVNDKRLKECERIALASTFDYVIIEKKNFPELISAFREFEGETSLKEQAGIIEIMMNDENCIAAGFNQTSVNADTWTNIGGYNEEKEESLPYNILTGDKHWELFEEMCKERE